jgi:hypothetical protein
VVHIVSSYRQIGILSDRLALAPYKVVGRIGYEPAPIENEGGISVALRGRRIDLVKRGIVMAPEGCPPLEIKLFYIAVILAPKPISESRFAAIAKALTA